MHGVLIYLQWQKGLPIEVLSFAYKPVQLKLQALGGSADLRIAKQKAVSNSQVMEVLYFCVSPANPLPYRVLL